MADLVRPAQFYVTARPWVRMEVGSQSDTDTTSSTLGMTTKLVKRAGKALGLGALCLAVVTATPFATGADEAPSPGVMEAVGIAVDTYIYGYPLVTFDMMRKQQTDVATPDAEHAPMGQMIKMRAIPGSTTTAARRPTPTRCTPKSGWTFPRSRGSSASPTWAAATTLCQCWMAGPM